MKNSIMIMLCFICLNSFGQEVGSLAFKDKRLLDISVRKTGPYIGIQRGKYTVLEIGAELQWKKIRLKKPVVQAIHTGFNYNFKRNVLGYDIGYWIRPHRFGLTYGLTPFFRTDFEHSRFGAAPVIGYKIWFLHLQTGYHFIPNFPTDFETNRFFVSLKFGMTNDRDVDIDWRKKKKKK